MARPIGTEKRAAGGRARDSTDRIMRRSPREEFRTLTRTRILEAARFCFERKGYSAVTIEDIAARAVVSRTVVYQYFENKSEIFSQLMADDEVLVLQSFISRMPRDFKNRARIREAMLAILTIYRSQSGFWRVMMEAAAVEKKVSDWLESIMQNCVNAVIEHTRGRADGDFGQEHSFRIRVLIAITAMDALFGKLMDRRWDIDEGVAIEEMVDLWSHLLAGPPPTL